MPKCFHMPDVVVLQALDDLTIYLPMGTNMFCLKFFSHFSTEWTGGGRR